MSDPTPRISVDLNSDMGESYGRWQLGDDEAMLGIVSSANVACGLHAGDPGVMAHTFERARARGVAVGAHPGYPDLWGFGRREMAFTPSEIEQFVAYQIGAAQAVSGAAGHPITYVKPHGALAHLTRTDEQAASAVVRAIRAVDASLALLTFPDGKAIRIAREIGLPVCAEIFADRGYEPDGSLISRNRPGAVLSDVETVARRALDMVRSGEILAHDGTRIPMEIGSICVHGDSPGAVAMASAVRRALTENGIEIKPFT